MPFFCTTKRQSPPPPPPPPPHTHTHTQPRTVRIRGMLPLADSFLVLMIFAAYSWPDDFFTQRRTTEKAPLRRAHVITVSQGLQTPQVHFLTCEKHVCTHKHIIHAAHCSHQCFPTKVESLDRGQKTKGLVCLWLGTIIQVIQGGGNLKQTTSSSKLDFNSYSV